MTPTDKILRFISIVVAAMTLFGFAVFARAEEPPKPQTETVFRYGCGSEDIHDVKGSVTIECGAVVKPREHARLVVLSQDGFSETCAISADGHGVVIAKGQELRCIAALISGAQTIDASDQDRLGTLLDVALKQYLRTVMREIMGEDTKKEPAK